MIGHGFIDPEILQYYRHGCYTDPESAGCNYFITKYYENVDEINPYSIFQLTQMFTVTATTMTLSLI